MIDGESEGGDCEEVQCNSSYGFPVTVRITAGNFYIFQLQLLLLLTYLTFSVTITVTDPVIKC